MEIRLYATLREIVGGKSVYIDSLPEMTIEHLLQEIFIIHPALRAQIYDQEGQLRPSIHVLVNGRDTRFLAGLDTPVQAHDQVSIFPPVGGGGPKAAQPASKLGPATKQGLTRVTLKFTTHARERMGRDRLGFTFAGDTLRALLNDLCAQYDVGDLILDARGEVQSGLQVVINGRFAYLMGHLDAPIHDGDLVVLIHRSTVAF